MGMKLLSNFRPQNSVIENPEMKCGICEEMMSRKRKAGRRNEGVINAVSEGLSPSRTTSYVLEFPFYSNVLCVRFEENYI